MIEHDIKAEDLCTKRVFKVIWLGGAIKVLNYRLSNAQCFDDEIFDFCLHLFAFFLTELFGDTPKN